VVSWNRWIDHIGLCLLFSIHSNYTVSQKNNALKSDTLYVSTFTLCVPLQQLSFCINHVNISILTITPVLFAKSYLCLSFLFSDVINVNFRFSLVLSKIDEVDDFVLCLQFLAEMTRHVCVHRDVDSRH